jgi:hypothetical protein
MSGSINTRLSTRCQALQALAAAVAVALALGGCGASASDQVRAEVDQLARATATRAYGTICDQILAPSLIAHLTSNGIPCAQALRLALGDVRNPVVSVGKVIIRGSRAWAITLTGAHGQRAELVAIELSHTGQGWRITSLASPLSAVRGR